MTALYPLKADTYITNGLIYLICLLNKGFANLWQVSGFLFLIGRKIDP
jgi:hypothetical protein